MNTIYCGNNARHPDLLNGTKVLGTRYSCLQKGKNNGLNQPIDPNFLLPYQPIDTTRKYCGNKTVLPVGYDRFGGLYECYLSGVGVGKREKATGNNIGNPPSPSPIVSSYESSNRSDINYNEDISDLKYNGDSDSKETIKSYQSLLGVNRTESSPREFLRYEYSNRIDSDRKDISKSVILSRSNIVGVIVYMLGFSLFFIGMYYGRPSIITYSDYKDDYKDKIDWSKFIPYLVSFAVLYGVLVYFFIKYLFKYF